MTIERVEVVPAARHRDEVAFEALEQALGGRALIACDQFVYFDPSNPKRCLAPDVAIRLGTTDRLLHTWKTWELGAPHVGVEIVSDTDDFEMTLERYRHAGIAELVRFDANDVRQPLRLWDLIEGDLVERDLSDPLALHCDALGIYWRVRIDDMLGPTLRLARDAEGTDLLPTRAEAALAKVAALEAELAKLR